MWLRHLNHRSTGRWGQKNKKALSSYGVGPGDRCVCVCVSHVTHQWPWASQGTVDWRTSRPPINGPARHVCQSTAWGQPGGSIDRCHMRPINGPRPFSLLGLSPRSQVDTVWAQTAGAAGKVAVQVEKAAVLEAIKSSRRQKKKKGRRR